MVLLLVKDLKAFVCHFLDRFRSGLFSFFVQSYGRHLGVEEFGCK